MILPAIALAVAAPSFDCTRATTKVEKMICADPELATMDAAVGLAYRGRRSLQERRDQRQWLKQRDTCADRECLIATYEERMMLFFPDRGAQVRNYRSDDNDGRLSILPTSNGWYAFSVVGQWRTAGGSVNIAMAGGAFRLDKSGRASRAPAGEMDCGWRIEKLRGDRWLVRSWPGSQDPACGGHNATIDGIYGRRR